jgi:hypothetical protein
MSDSDPVVNPLNFSMVSTAPTYTTGSNTLAFIYATVQLINGVQRPTIPAFSPTGSVTSAEIHTAVSTGTSSANAYVRNNV